MPSPLRPVAEAVRPDKRASPDPGRLAGALSFRLVCDGYINRRGFVGVLNQIVSFNLEPTLVCLSECRCPMRAYVRLVRLVEGRP